jgi:hypothetical protein
MEVEWTTLLPLQGLTTLGAERIIGMPVHPASELPNLRRLILRDISTDRRQISEWTSLTSLRVWSMVPETEIWKFSKLRNLKTFQMWTPEMPTFLTNLTSLGCSSLQLPSITHLQSLQKIRCPVRDEDFEELKKLTNLVSLGIINDFDEISMLTKLTQLKTGADTRKSFPDANVFALTSLTFLEAEYPIPVSDLRSLTNLRSLVLDENQGKEFSENLTVLTNLTELSAFYDVVPDHVIQKLPNLTLLTRLKGEDTCRNRFEILEYLLPESSSSEESSAIYGY